MVASSLSICLGVTVLVFFAIFLLGWIWPLVAGIARNKRGESGTPLIVVGSIWGFISISSLCLIGVGAYFIYDQSSQYSVSCEFDPAEYEGATATATLDTEYNAKLTARCEDMNYTFTSKDGSFSVPAAEIVPQNLSITGKKEGGVDWTANWWFYSNAAKHTFTPEANGTVALKWGPPLTAKIIMKGANSQTQKLDLKVTDSSGLDVRLRSREAPSFDIVDSTGEVVWTYKMRYS